MKIYSTFIIYLAFVSPAFNQHVLIPGTNYPFLSEIITFKSDTIDLFIQISPVDSTIDLSAVPPVMDQEFIRKQLIYSLNAFRKKYGKKPLKYSLEISDNLAYVFENQAPISGLTWSTYATFREYNYLRNFKNKEARFCDLLMDNMSVTAELFKELIKDDAKEAGFYFKENQIDRTYDFAIYVK
jgi:hypothetical protein